MNNLVIPVSSVKITDQKLIEALLPNDSYKLRDIGQGYFEVLAVGVVCATVVVKDGGIFFQFAQGTDYQAFWGAFLKRELLLKHPELDPDRIQWIVVFPLCDAWSYSGSPKETKEAALQNLAPITFGKPGAMLVGFKASEWPCLVLKVDHRFEITGTWECSTVGADDQGEKIFSFTNLENFVKNEE